MKVTDMPTTAAILVIGKESSHPLNRLLSKLLIGDDGFISVNPYFASVMLWSLNVGLRIFFCVSICKLFQ